MILRLVALFLLLTSPLAAQGRVSIDYAEASGGDRPAALGVPPDQHQQSPRQRAGGRALAERRAGERGHPGDDPRYRGARPRASQLLRPAAGRARRTRHRAGAPHGRGHRDGEGLDGGSVRRRDPRRLRLGPGRAGHEGPWHHPAHGVHRAQAGRRSAHAGPGVRRQRRRGDRGPGLEDLPRASPRPGEADRVRPHRGGRHAGGEGQGAVVRDRRRGEAHLVEEAGGPRHDLARLGARWATTRWTISSAP